MIKTKFVLIFGMLIFISSAAGGEVLCGKESPSGVLYTTKSGKCWSYSCENGKAVYKSLEEAAKCGIGVKCKEGEKRTFTPEGKKCEQTCCTNGRWSKCNKSCANHGCAKGECYDGGKCTAKPAEYKETKGKCEYRYNCKEYVCGASGWVCKNKELKEVINNNGRTQKGEWQIKAEYKGQGEKCGAGIVVNEKTAKEDCIKHNASLMKKSAAEIERGNITFSGQCYVRGSNGEYSILKCSVGQEECKK